MKAAGRLFIVSAPSGAGKTTLIRYILKRIPSLSYSISHTTRPPRKNEKHGMDYFFISQSEFKKKISRNYWLEWAQVHHHYYGTSKKFVKSNLENGKSLILDIDIQGARQIMESNLDIISIFIMPPSFDSLSERLKARGTDSEQVINTRLNNARKEMDQREIYQHVVVNDDLDQAVEDLYHIFINGMA